MSVLRRPDAAAQTALDMTAARNATTVDMPSLRNYLHGMREKGGIQGAGLTYSVV